MYLRRFNGRGSKNRTHDTRFWRCFSLLLVIDVFTMHSTCEILKIRQKYDTFAILNYSRFYSSANCQQVKYPH